MRYMKVVSPVLVLSGLFVVIFATVIPSKKNENNFQLLCQTESTSGSIPVYKFVSLRTGLHVIIANIEGPTVQGFFTIATEAHDDDGLPHTLEHLVFLGSEDYPYKGVLDLLANRCLAEGTNAWTDTDHTAYTVDTAGKDGFLNFLPIYLEHLLYPTLTDAGFATEVYHVDGDGNDAGVVYSEMQARENTGSELTYNKLLQILYPEPSGYRHETGGIMSNLRNNITNQKIRKYHEAMYRPENLHVIIAGQIDPKEVFQAMNSIEEKIVSKGDRSTFERPWESPVPPFETSENVEIVYPSDNEDTGIVRIGWRGPSLVHNITEFQSVEVLLKYLTEVSVSPLPKIFVEIKDPLASYVYAYLLEYSITSAVIIFGGVPVSKINSVETLLMETLNKIVNEEIPFDEGVMKNTLTNLILKEESKMESSPHSTLSDYVILHILYGSSCQDLSTIINKKMWYEHLISEPTTYWLNLIKKYFITAPSALVRGIPSVAAANKLQEEDRKRVEQRKARLGEVGLLQLANSVEEAERINEIPPPENMLESVPVPSTANINFHSHKAFTNIEKHSSGFIPKSDPSLMDLNAVPVKMQLNDVKSNFVQLLGIMDTYALTPSERLYIPLLMELLLESSIQNGSEVLPYEDVIKNLYEDTVKAENINGLSIQASTFGFGPYFHNVMIELKMEMRKYEKGVEWLSNILFRVVFEAERVVVKASKLLNSVGDKKRDGSSMLTLMANDIVFKEDSNINKGNALRQEKFLMHVLETMKTNPSKIMEDLNKVYKTITNLDSITVVMATKLQKLASVTNATKPWLTFAPNGTKSHNMNLHVISDAEEVVAFNDTLTNGYVAGIKSLESAYLFQTTKAISNYSHVDLPALLTAISYFTQLEGPMWKEIRGKGLAYSYSITMKSNSGLMSLRLVKAAHLLGAYKEALNIFNSYLNGTKPWKRLLFESAKSSLVYEIVEREMDISDVVQQALYAYYRKVDHDYNKSFLRDIDNVTIEDMQRMIEKYLKPLIDPKTSKIAVICPSTKAAEIRDDLAKFGHSVELVNALETSTFANL